jgi:hypothetical protein
MNDSAKPCDVRPIDVIFENRRIKLGILKNRIDT